MNFTMLKPEDIEYLDDYVYNGAYETKTGVTTDKDEDFNFILQVVEFTNDLGRQAQIMYEMPKTPTHEQKSVSIFVRALNDVAPHGEWKMVTSDEWVTEMMKVYGYDKAHINALKTSLEASIEANKLDIEGKLDEKVLELVTSIATNKKDIEDKLDEKVLELVESIAENKLDIEGKFTLLEGVVDGHTDDIKEIRKSITDLTSGASPVPVTIAGKNGLSTLSNGSFVQGRFIVLQGSLFGENSVKYSELFKADLPVGYEFVMEAEFFDITAKWGDPSKPQSRQLACTMDANGLVKLVTELTAPAGVTFFFNYNTATKA